MLFGALLFGAEHWLLPAAGLMLAALLALGWSYRRARAVGWVRGVCGTLKALGLLALALCLLEPSWTGARPRPGENVVVILADNSQSMQIRGQQSLPALGERFRGALSQVDAPWQVRLKQDFEVRQYLFDSRIESTGDFGQLHYDGRASSLGQALKTLAERYQGRNLAAVMLFSDGNATDLSGAANIAGLPPLYPVVTAEDEPAQDISLENIVVSQTNFEDAPVSIQADVAAQGYADVRIACQLLDADGKKIEEQIQKLPGDNKPLAFRFQLRPANKGLFFYQVRVSAADALDQFTRPERTKEATLANNTRLVMVDRGSGPYRILYVSGRPNWEFKFLRRAIEDDEQIQLVGLIRIAKREPKFDWRGRAGESTNPLFRGFRDKSDEELEAYDQPVLVRLGTLNEAELRGGFPKTEDQLFAYHALVVDDLEAEFFTHDQMALISRFVSQRGGGLLMLGGQESFQKGEYQRTPLGDLLPVYLDRALESRSADPVGLRLALSREGWLQPWVRLRNNETDEQRRLEEMPAFRTLNRVAGIKPGASILATVTDSSAANYPALVAQRFGSGRSAAITIGDLWRWRLRSEPENLDQEKAWRQTLRWLVADVPGRVELEVRAAHDQPHQPIELAVRVRDPKYQPLDNASVSFTVVPPSGPRLPLAAEASLKEPGLYEASYIPRQSGAYRVEAVVKDGAGAEVGKAETGWTADPAADEFRTLGVNRPLLERLAADSGGELVDLDGLQSFVESLPNRKLPVTEQSLDPLWHKPWFFLFAILCLAGEWGLRRLRGLA